MNASPASITPCIPRMKCRGHLLPWKVSPTVKLLSTASPSPVMACSPICPTTSLRRPVRRATALQPFCVASGGQCSLSSMLSSCFDGLPPSSCEPETERITGFSIGQMSIALSMLFKTWELPTWTLLLLCRAGGDGCHRSASSLRLALGSLASAMRRWVGGVGGGGWRVEGWGWEMGKSSRCVTI